MSSSAINAANWQRTKWDPLATCLSIMVKLYNAKVSHPNELRRISTHVGVGSETSALPCSSTPPATLSSTQQRALPAGLFSGFWI